MSLAESFPQLLKPAEAAERLGISRDTFDALVKAGKIRFVDVGRGKVNAYRRFDPADLGRLRRPEPEKRYSMSLEKREGSPFFYYRFKVNGRRFFPIY